MPADKHYNGSGTAQIKSSDVFTLVARPLHSSPQHFIGVCPVKGVKTVRTASCAKQLSHVEAVAWLEMLSKRGYEFYLCTHEPAPRKPRIKILRQEEK